MKLGFNEILFFECSWKCLVLTLVKFLVWTVFPLGIL